MTALPGYEINILGGCATRDVFSELTSESPLSHKYAVKMYWPRSTFVSMTADAFSFSEEHLTSDSAFRNRVVRMDLNKHFMNIHEHNERVIILDFLGQSRYNELTDGKTFISSSGYLEETRIPENHLLGAVAYSSVRWKRSCLQIIEFLQARYELILLHECYFSNEFIHHAGRTCFSSEILSENELLNNKLSDMYGFFKDNCPDCLVIESNTNSNISDSEHRWGLDTCHFVYSFYFEILEQIDHYITNRLA